MPLRYGYGSRITDAVKPSIWLRCTALELLSDTTGYKIRTMTSIIRVFCKMQDARMMDVMTDQVPPDINLEQ